MSVFLQPIYTQTVGSGGASTIDFNNIPQTFTDLMIIISARTNRSATQGENYVYFNNDNNNLYSYTFLQGSGTATGSSRASNIASFTGLVPGANATSSTFGNGQVYIPNYTGNQFKSWNNESVQENNASVAYVELIAGLYRSTNAITRLTFSTFGGGNYVQYSTISLYGITRG
jgi:hypothetical protein